MFRGLLLDCHISDREIGRTGEEIKKLHIALIFHRRA